MLYKLFALSTYHLVSTLETQTLNTELYSSFTALLSFFKLCSEERFMEQEIQILILFYILQLLKYIHSLTNILVPPLVFALRLTAYKLRHNKTFSSRCTQQP